MVADLLGAEVAGVEFPGGRSRRSCRVLLADGGSVIATLRGSPRRASLEATVLRGLAAHGAPVPRVLAFDGGWLIQEDLGRRRLSQVMADGDGGAGGVERALDAALRALAAAHRAGEAAGLGREVPVLGASEAWLLELLARPRRLGGHLGLPAPDLPLSALVARLGVPRPSLVKWDARPGNALVRDDGRVIWFDWEHCGRRNRLDDVAWLLGDEFTPDLPEVEERLLARHLPAFAADGGGVDPAEAATYLAAYGTLHMCVRLGLILATKGDGPWWDWRRCLDGDKVGVTPPAARRTCLRAARWAARTPLTERLAPWLARVAARLADTDDRPAAR